MRTLDSPGGAPWFSYRPNCAGKTAARSLSASGGTRRALLATKRELRHGCVPAKAIEAVVGDIDGLATLITGDCAYYHLKPHSVGTLTRR